MYSRARLPYGILLKGSRNFSSLSSSIQNYGTSKNRTLASQANEKIQEPSGAYTAEQFKLGSKLSYQHGMQLVELILKMRLKSTDVIMDVGCGNGNITENMSNIVPHKNILAFDVLPSMIQFANENHSGETIDYFVGDIGVPWKNLDEKLKKMSGKVDVIISNHCFHVVIDQNQAFANLSKLLRNGGHLLTNIPILPDVTEYYFPNEKINMNGNSKYIKSKTKHEQTQNYIKMLVENGFSVLDLKEFFGEWYYDSEEDLMAFVGPIANACARKMLNPNIVDSAKNDVHPKLVTLLCKIFTETNFQNLMAEQDSPHFGLYRFFSYFLRYVCKINK